MSDRQLILVPTIGTLLFILLTATILRTGSAYLGPNVISRVYDVRDLEASLAQPDQTRQQVVDGIIARVETIAPPTWRDNGGQVGWARELSGCLIITHTPAMHARVTTLLSDLRRGSSAPPPFTLNSPVVSCTFQPSGARTTTAPCDD